MTTSRIRALYPLEYIDLFVPILLYTYVEVCTHTNILACAVLSMVAQVVKYTYLGYTEKYPFVN